MTLLKPTFVCKSYKTLIDKSRFLVRYTQTKIQAPRLNPAIKKKKKTFLESGYILLTIPALTLGLGIWQVKRREEKLTKIALLEDRTSGAPVSLPEDLDEIKEMEYRPVCVRGTFDHSKEMWIGPRSNLLKRQQSSSLISTDSVTGMIIVTPFTLSDRDLTILVNRGWVPAKKAKKATRPEGQVQGEVEIVGLVRREEKRSVFMPKADPKSQSCWLYREIDTMAEFSGASPIFIDANSQSSVPGGPLGGQTLVSMRNDHMSYIITWFSLSVITFYIWFKRFKQPPPPKYIPLEYFRK